MYKWGAILKSKYTKEFENFGVYVWAALRWSNIVRWQTKTGRRIWYQIRNTSVLYSVNKVKNYSELFGESFFFTGSFLCALVGPLLKRLFNAFVIYFKNLNPMWNEQRLK